MAASVAAAASAVVVVQDDVEASSLMCKHAWDVINAELARAAEPLPPYPIEGSSPMFVTWDTIDGKTGRASLRGCIGTLSPCSLFGTTV